MMIEQTLSFDVESIELSKFSSLLSKLSVSQKEVIYLVAKEHLDTFIKTDKFIALTDKNFSEEKYNQTLEAFRSSLMRHPSFISIQAIEDGTITVRAIINETLKLAAGAVVVGVIQGASGVDFTEIGEDVGQRIKAYVEEIASEIVEDERLHIANVVNHRDERDNSRLISSKIVAVREEEDKLIIRPR